MNVLDAPVLDGHGVTDLDLERRDIHLASVHFDMSVIYKLACLAPRRRKARTVHDVIQPLFKHEKQVLARDTLLAACLFEIIAKLFLEHKVNTLYLLLFT